MLKSFILFGSLILSTVYCFAVDNIFKTSQDTALYRKNPLYEREIEMYNVYKTKNADVVMLGNSLVHGANWNELLGRDKVVERGISSDVIEGFINRLDYIINLKPKVCFVMGGINDIYNWIPVEQIFSDYVFLIKRLKANGINAVIQSTLYVAKRYPSSEDRNKQVTLLNEMLEKYCKINSIDFIDLNKNMSSNGYLIDSYTYDGVHLKAKGYKIWAHEVDKELIKLGL